MWCRVRRARWREGFTLVEALLAIVIIGAMVATTGNLLISGMDSYRLIVDRGDALQDARLAINYMSNELETIEDPTADIASISAAGLTFTPAGGGSVTYAVSGSNLLRDANILAQNINGVQTQFEYFTVGGVVTTNPAQVYRIRMTIAVNTDDPGHGTLTLVSNVYLRNRYYGSFTRI